MPKSIAWAMFSRYYITGICMVLSGISSVVYKPNITTSNHKDSVNLEKIIPKTFADWSLDKTVIPVIVSQEVQSKLDTIYNQTLTRTYINQSHKRIMLSIVYGANQSDSLRLHRPEVCYTSQGFSVSKPISKLIQINRDVAIPVIQVNATNGDRYEPITYWVTIGDKVINSTFKRKLEQMRYTIKRLIPEGYLIRVSSLGRNQKREHKLQEEFIVKLLMSMDDNFRKKLIGSNSDKSG